MTTRRQYIMPKTEFIGQAMAGGPVKLSDAHRGYYGGLEDVSGRVSANVAPLAGVTTAATMSAKIDALIAALIAAKLMQSS